jgi:uncharacterized protein (DUF3084 family)
LEELKNQLDQSRSTEKVLNKQLKIVKKERDDAGKELDLVRETNKRHIDEKNKNIDAQQKLRQLNEGKRREMEAMTDQLRKAKLKSEQDVCGTIGMYQ